jgi:purine nucleosidase
VTDTATPETVFYLDCDTGIDDALALAYLLGTAGDRLVGIGATNGNVAAAVGAENTLRLLGLAGATVPVALGEHHPRRGSFDGGAPHVHGADGVGGVPLPEVDARLVAESAVELLADLVERFGERLHIIAIAPLTTISRALDVIPGLASRVDGITLMGGAVTVPGNITPHAEANIANDAHAAAHVLAAEWRSATVVPLDVTMRHRFEPRHTEELARDGGALATAVSEMFEAYFDFYEPGLGVRAAPLHDPLAAAIAVGDVVIEQAIRGALAVDTSDSPERGRTTRAEIGPSTTTVLEVGGDAAERILRGARTPRLR